MSLIRSRWVLNSRRCYSLKYFQSKFLNLAKEQDTKESLDLLSTRDEGDETSSKGLKVNKRMELQQKQLRHQLKHLLQKDSETIKQEQFKFVTNHFGAIVDNINQAMVDSKFDYSVLDKAKINHIIKNTTSQARLMRIFNNLVSEKHRFQKLDCPMLLNILLNKSLQDQFLINSILNTMLQKDNMVLFNNWKQQDYISLQVGLVQKFFSMRKLDYVDKLIKMNFKLNWIPFILSQDRTNFPNKCLPLNIERSIWRIFFLFKKDYGYMINLLENNDIPTSSLYLLFESIPKSFFNKLEHPHNIEINFFNILLTKLSNSKDLSPFQIFFNDLFSYPWIISNVNFFESLKKISISSKLSQNFLFNEKIKQFNLNTSQTLDIQNPLSSLLFSTLAVNNISKNENIKALQYSRNSNANKILKLKGYNSLLLLEIQKFIEDLKVEKIDNRELIDQLKEIELQISSLITYNSEQL